MAHDIFISYSKHDKVVADTACATLEAAGIRCWIAPRDVGPGMEWGGSIVRAIEQCRVMVLIFSGNANQSQQIRREVERAVNKGRSIVTMRIEDIEPDQSLEYFIGNLHWLDALTPPLAQHMKRLADAVAALLDLPAAPHEADAAGKRVVAKLRPAQDQRTEGAKPRAAPASVMQWPRLRLVMFWGLTVIAAAAIAYVVWLRPWASSPAVVGAFDFSGQWSGFAYLKKETFNYEWFMRQDRQHVSGTIALSKSDDSGSSGRSVYTFEGDIRQNKLYFHGVSWFTPKLGSWCMASGQLIIPEPGSNENKLSGTWGPLSGQDGCPANSDGDGAIYLTKK